MISDFETNTVYFSELIAVDDRFKKTFKEIEASLNTFNVKPNLISKTKDIWARDYMPIQSSDKKFIEYRFDPDYLQGHWKGCRNLKTSPDIVCEALKLKTEKLDLILDGGNFVKSSNAIILTDKILKENRYSYQKNELIQKLYDVFQVDKVILIPWFKKEKYGHSDGVLRFIDSDTVLVSHYYRTDSVMLYRLKSSGLKPEFIDFKVKKRDERNWAYINFLQTKDLILLPNFGIDEDEQAFEQIENFYPDYKGKVAKVNMTDVVKFGGALNCITWTTKE